MRPLDRLSEYLHAVERRLRLLAFTRGIAATAVAALIFTLVAVLVANHYAFSKTSVLSARFLLFFGLAFAIGTALVVPIIRLNRRRAARAAETTYPQFEERLLTITEKMDQNAGDPFLQLLADETLTVAQHTEAKAVAKTTWVFSFSSAAAVALGILLWLGLAGPGFLGYGTSLLWGGLPKGNSQPFYDIQVEPGNHTIRKRADEVIVARLHGFSAPKVRFFGKYASSSRWEQTEMRPQPDGNGFEFVIAGVTETLDYYIEAGGIRSKDYKLTVIDLPSVKGIVTTYHYPAWTGMKDSVEDPGGDLRAVEGTTADVAIKTDRPLNSGVLLLDDGSKVALRTGSDGMLTAKVPIQKDGQYHIAAVENGEDVRLTEDYFIEAQQDRPPEIKLTKPGRDFRASPIEEVTVTAEASDDFGLKDVEVHYSVNGAPEKVASLLPNKGAKNATGSMTIALEDYKMAPGDVVSLYGVAKDARESTRTDMFFIEAQPFERNYSQSQQGGGGGGGGGGQGEQQNEISQRQKEIISATWNEIKGSGAKGTDAENAGFLSGVQGKLRDQAKSLADRMKARQLSEEGDSFKSFTKDMEEAVAAMGPASEKLKAGKWTEALGPEQQALQHLLRAEATRRDIQVAFGNSGGGGGGGAQGGARDLEGLFDLELDTEKNQFETGQQTQSADARQREIDEALQKLEQLARRQQELANQQRNNQQLSQRRYEQEQLRREAEQLQRQLDQLNRQMQNQPGQQGQQGQQQQQGQGQSGSTSQSGNQQSSSARSGGMDSQQLRQTISSLQQALDNMRKANSSQQSGTPQSEAEARRAAEQLKDAQQQLSGLRGQQSSGKVEDLARQAEDLAQRQQGIEGQLRRALANRQQQDGQGPGQGRMNQQQVQQLYQDRQKEVADLRRLESQMQNAVRDLSSTQPKASGQMRRALSDMQQQELARDMERNGEYIRRGIGEYAALSEATITQGMNQLRDQLKGVQQAMGENKDGKPGAGGANDKDNKAAEQALSQVEKLRQQLEQLQKQNGQRGQNGQGGQNGQQRAQNGLNRGQQPGGQQPGGQQGNQQGNQGGNQQGNQSGNQAGQGGQNRGPLTGGIRNGGTWGPLGGLGTQDPGVWNGGAIDPRSYERDYKDTLERLQALNSQLQNDPNVGRDLQGLVREMQRLNPFTYANDPELGARIQAAMLADVQQVEMELRRKVDAAGGGAIRSTATGPVPQGYEKPVAEYFRKLSSGK